MHAAATKPRLLIFVIAYYAESTLRRTLERIPQDVFNEYDCEVLVVDDGSEDRTFDIGREYKEHHPEIRMTVLRNELNQGYGGNQKVGHTYAVREHFQFVAMLHGDGQYAPEELPRLVAPLRDGQADAVFGSRMMGRFDALKGGMPLYKFLGNRILSRLQNAMLGTRLSEFHSGYRIYSVEALNRIPYRLNSNDFHFDTEIIIQLVLRKLRTLELPIPTFYGDEICYVNGLKYAWNVFRSTIKARLCRLHLFYDRKFDVQPVEDTYDLKLGYSSSHTAALAAAKPGGRILDVGCGQGRVAGELIKAGCQVTGMDRHIPAQSKAPRDVNFIRWDLDRPEFPVNVSEYDQVFLLDIIEHLKDPAHFMDELRFAAACSRPEIVLTTANISFIATRLMLLLGQFNYGKKGILDVTHTRLFTFRSIRELLKQSGYKILEVRGIPAPFPVALGTNFISRALVRCNETLIRLSKGLFSYQIYVRAEALPTVNNLLHETISGSHALKAEILSRAA